MIPVRPREEDEGIRALNGMEGGSDEEEGEHEGREEQADEEEEEARKDRRQRSGEPLTNPVKRS